MVNLIVPRQEGHPDCELKDLQPSCKHMLLMILPQEAPADFYVFCEECVVLQGRKPETTQKSRPSADLFCVVLAPADAVGPIIAGSSDSVAGFLGTVLRGQGHGVAGPALSRRRFGVTASRVCVFAATCDANRPQKQKTVAGPAVFADLRHSGKSPATVPGQTGNVP